MPRSVPGRASGRISLRLDAQGSGLSPAALIGALQGSGSITADNVQLAGLDPNGIDAAVRAADRGVPIDAIRIGDIVRTALESGRLNVPAVGGPIAIGGGRLTLGPIAAPAQGADVSFTGNYDLGADAINLRFDLIGPPRANTAGSERPQLFVTLKGPLDGPRRNVDVTSLVNWLSMRAVEQEAKRLEAAEQEAKRIRAQQDEARRRAEAARRAAEQAAMPTATVAPSFDKAPDLKAPELPPAIEIKPAPGGAALKPRHRSLPAPPGPAAPIVITPQDAR
jgi:AsmA-like C-terminal region